MFHASCQRLCHACRFSLLLAADTPVFDVAMLFAAFRLFFSAAFFSPLLLSLIFLRYFDADADAFSLMHCCRTFFFAFALFFASLIAVSRQPFSSALLADTLRFYCCRCL